jgi:hypothetical protein
MTGWMLEFDGEIYTGKFLGKSKKMTDFSGSGISSTDPDYHDADKQGKIFEEISKHFKLVPPYYIVLRMWHPSNIPTYHIKKLWVSP